MDNNRTSRIVSHKARVLSMKEIRKNRSSAYKTYFMGSEDDGLRATSRGRLYVNKKIFYSRKVVQEGIKKLKNIINEKSNKG